MKKILIMLCLVVLVSSVSAYCEGVGGTCADTLDCCVGLHCLGDTKTGSKTCRTDSGTKGQYCSGEGWDSDCYGNLVCAMMGTYSNFWFSCSECAVGAHENTGVFTEGASDIPLDTNCLNVGVNCSCNVKYTSNSWYNYGWWTSADNVCDSCQDSDIGSAECFTGLTCGLVQDGGGRRCLVPSGEDCCYDSDCNSGYYCDTLVNRCTLGSTTTTTSISTTTSTLSPLNECLNDTTCPKSEYCSTGFNPENTCNFKKESYLIQGSQEWCYRNHECLSGICSKHSSNGAVGDYPVYSPDVFDPYSENKGQCLPNYFTIDTVADPHFGIIGEEINILDSVKVNNLVAPLHSCSVFYNPIDDLNSNLTTSWAYTSMGNTFLTENNMQYNPSDDVWNYLTSEPAKINDTLSEGQYTYWTECLDSYGNIGGKVGVMNVVLANRTILQITSSPKNTQILGASNDLYIQVHDPHGNMLSGESCVIRFNGVNSSMVDSGSAQYLSHLNFNSIGTMTLEIWCNKPNYMMAYTRTSFSVQSPHCKDGMKNFDEDGVDCGGSCSPCEVTSCIDNFKSCSSDSSCCSGFCNSRTCNQASCSDSIRNQGEFKVDCGGPNCPPCPSCINNNDCSSDGSQYCDQSSYKCVYHNCTLDSQCYTLTWWMSDTQTYIQKPTTCDTNYGLCKFTNFNSVNQTQNIVGLDVSPISGLTSNTSGTILYIGNCDDKSNGFKVKTNSNAMLSYSFASSSFAPNIGANPANKNLGIVDSSGVSVLVPELCNSFPIGAGRIYAKVNMLSCVGSQCSNIIVDTLTFRNNLKNSLSVILDPSSQSDKLYLFNATNRSISVWVKYYGEDKYQNVSSGYSNPVRMNNTIYALEKSYIDSFKYLVNTSEGESMENQYGSPIWMVVTADPRTGWPKLNFTVRSWMIPIMVTFLIIAAIYASYKYKKKEV